MSIHKIQRSMEMILEGVDSLDVSLILEANGEFLKGIDSLKKNLSDFYNVCKPFKELALFNDNVEYNLEKLNKLDASKISSEYSFTDHYKLQSVKPKEDEGEFLSPEYIVSSTALEYPTMVSALRDSILEIAKWLEQYPEVFSVGKNGIVFSESFRSVIKNEDLKIQDFAQSGDEIITLMSGIQDTSPEKTEIKSHFENIWKTEDIEKEKEDEAWDKFVAGFDTIGQAAQSAHDSASNAIKGISPPKEVKTSGEKSGGILKSVLGSIFGSESNGKVEKIHQRPEYIIGDSIKSDTGIFAMTFTDLQKLIASVIEFAGSSASAGANALAGLDSHQKESMKPSKKEASTIKKIKDISPKINNEKVAEIGAGMEEAGMEDGDTSKIDNSKLRDLLMKMYDKDEEKVNAILKGLDLEDDKASGEQDEAEDKSPLDVISDLSKVGDEFKDELIDLAKEGGLMNDSGEATPPNSREDVDDVVEVVEDELEEDEEEELRASLKPSNESRLRESFSRWSLLAGIKMDN